MIKENPYLPSVSIGSIITIVVAIVVAIVLAVVGGDIAIVRIIAWRAVHNMLAWRRIWMWIRLRVIRLCGPIADDDDDLRLGAARHSDQCGDDDRSCDRSNNCVSHFDTLLLHAPAKYYSNYGCMK
jgi:hypothetical protein